MMGNFVKYNCNGWQGFADAEFASQIGDLDSWLAGSEKVPVVSYPDRDVYRTQVGGDTYFVKYIRALTAPGLTGKDRFSWCKWVLRPSRAIHTWKISRELLDADFNCPEPVLAVRRRISGYPNDIFISRAVDAKDAWELLGNFDMPETERRKIVVSIAEETARFHNAGFVHGDLLLRNVCIDGDGKVVFIDNDRTKRSGASDRNLAQMGYSLMRRFNNPVWLHLFFAAYSLLRPLSPSCRHSIVKGVMKRYYRRVKTIAKQNPQHPELAVLRRPSLEELPIFPVAADTLTNRSALEALLPHAMLLREATTAGNTDAYVLRVSESEYWLIKTYARHGWLARHTIGAFAINHEYHNLRMMEKRECNAIPRPIAKVGSHTVIMEFLVGAKELQGKYHYTAETKPSMEFFQRLEALVLDFHAKGIAHGDMRCANIMIMPDATPRLIDWATGNTRSSIFSKIAFKYQASSDEYSLYRIIRSYYPDAMEEQWNNIKKKMPALLKLGRAFRTHVYKGGLKSFFRVVEKKR